MGGSDSQVEEMFIRQTFPVLEQFAFVREAQDPPHGTVQIFMH